MNVPPPPPPPPAASKAPVPSSNRALLSSIEKGTKLKKVPESLKNDRSVLAKSSGATGVSSAANRNAPPPGRSLNGDCKQPAIGKSFSSIQNELASQLASKASTGPSNHQPNVRKAPPGPVVGPNAAIAVNAGAATARMPMRSAAPPHNQFSAASVNKPPPPPPLNKKPNNAASRHSISEAMAPISVMRNHSERVASQAPPVVVKKTQPPVPRQLSSSIVTQPKPQVTRVTSTPPPPLPNALREAPVAPRVCPPAHGAPPVPQRVVSQALPGGGSPKMGAPARTPSLVSQYNVFDRPPPPPPPSFAASSIASAPSMAAGAPHNFQQQQKYSTSFDRRFKFPDERSFPNLRQGAAASLAGNRVSQRYSPITH